MSFGTQSNIPSKHSTVIWVPKRIVPPGFGTQSTTSTSPGTVSWVPKPGDIHPFRTHHHISTQKVLQPSATKIENAAFDALMNVLEDLNVDVSSGIDGTNMVDFVNKVQYSIKDGYMQFGFDVNLDGTVTASYLFHKELEITETFAKIPMP
ncbi:MAG: hypothetical protein IJK17_03600 [Lachnospiraceae bacterium]|nr:hypothetical protein [Lachnospiraceae bacterium]